MRTRWMTAAVVAVAALGLSACASTEAGTAVRAETSAQATTGTRDGGTDAPSTEQGGTEQGSTEESGTEQSSSEQSTDNGGAAGAGATAVQTGTDASSRAGATPAEEPTTEGAGGSKAGASGGAEAWPEDMCSLIPAELVKGLEKQDGDPGYRCLYTGSVAKGKYGSVSITKGLKIDADDPSNGQAVGAVTKDTIDGRTVWSWASRSDRGTAAFNYADRSAYVVIANEAQPAKENVAAAKRVAEIVSKALRGDGPKAPATVASTSYAKIPAGTRGIPKVICDLVPADQVAGFEKAKGYETVLCRYTKDTSTGQESWRIEPGFEIDPAEPATSLYGEVKQESFDGRTAYSAVRASSGSVAGAVVVFATGEKTSIGIYYSAFDVKTKITNEQARAKALVMAKAIAPKLPKP